METYKTFQRNWIILFTMIPLMILIFILWYYQLGTNPIPPAGMIGIEIFLLITYSFFYGLTITVSDEFIKLRFGIGLIKKKFEIDEIKETRLVKNKWYYGIGIRVIPHGMLYNAHGLKAVEMSFKNKNGIARIGASDTQELKNEIDKQIKRRRPRMS